MQGLPRRLYFRLALRCYRKLQPLSFTRAASASTHALDSKVQETTAGKTQVCSYAVVGIIYLQRRRLASVWTGNETRLLNRNASHPPARKKEVEAVGGFFFL